MRETFWQLVRFGIAGGLATLCYAMVYSPLAAFTLRAAFATDPKVQPKEVDD